MTRRLKDGFLGDSASDGFLTESTLDGFISDLVSAWQQQPRPARTPVVLVVLTLDFCGRTFGVSPCLATGTKCYNTWGTCKYKSAYLKLQKDYRFTTAAARAAFTDARPYVTGISIKPTEIKTTLTVAAQADVDMADEPDADVGIDPYWETRASHPGTFWKKLIARNPNFKGRHVSIYEGFLGDLESEFTERWCGSVHNFQVKPSGVRITAKDRLRDLAKVFAPPKQDIRLAGDLDATFAGVATLTTVDGLNASGAVRIGDEVISYTSIDATLKQIVGLTRGAYRSTPEAHQRDDKVQKCRIYSGNPWDILKDQLLKEDGGLEDDELNLTSFADTKAWPITDVNCLAVVTEPTKVHDLVMELVDLFDGRIWIGEDLKVTVKRNVPNRPGRTYPVWSDADSVAHRSGAVDQNDKARITRCAIYWDKVASGKQEESGSYNRLQIAIDADAESESNFNEIVEHTIYSRWIGTSYLQEEVARSAVEALAARKVLQNRDPQPLVTAEVDLKDSAIKTGDLIKLTTDELLAIDGNVISGEVFEVVKRDAREMRISYQLRRMQPRRILIAAPVGTPDYTSATEAQREYGFACGADGLMSNGDPGYHAY